MEKLVEKLGLYDILSIFLTGVIVLLITVFGFNLNELEEVNMILNSAYVIPVAYFVGVIFNECGNLIYRRLCRLLGKNILLEKVFKKSIKYNINSSSDLELDKLKNYFETYYPEIKIIDDRYQFCKQKCKPVSNNDQTIGAMARSFALFFILFGYFHMIWLLCICDDICICLPILEFVVCLLLSIFFLFRYIRFAEKRYISIIRKFIYKYVI